jgi:hypothetical protein
MVGLILTARGSDDAEQSEFPQITAQPTDQDVAEGTTTTFTVEASNGDLTYQWMRNGVTLEGQTNKSLIIENVGVDDVGQYSCNVSKEMETVPTRSACLNVSALFGDQIIVFGLPIICGGTQGTCPGPYAGYVAYTKSVAEGWGWAPSATNTVHSATDVTRTDTKVIYTGRSGDKGCAQTTVTVPHPTFSTKYRFAIYFTNNVPTNAYPILLEGFNL